MPVTRIKMACSVYPNLSACSRAMHLPDTDHILLISRDSFEWRNIVRRLAILPRGEIVVSVVSYEEQMRGWLPEIAVNRRRALVPCHVVRNGPTSNALTVRLKTIKLDRCRAVPSFWGRRSGWVAIQEDLRADGGRNRTTRLSNRCACATGAPTEEWEARSAKTLMSGLYRAWALGSFENPTGYVFATRKGLAILINREE